MSRNIVHIITSLDGGGAERMLTRIATYDFGGESCRQVVVSLMDDGLYGSRLRDAGIEVHNLGMRRGRMGRMPIFRLAGILRRLRPDVVMTWLYHADLLGTLAAPLAGSPPVVWNLRCSNLDFRLYPRTTRWIAGALAHLSPLPAAVAYNSETGRQAHAALGYRPRRWDYLPNGFDLDEWRPDDADRAQVRRELGLGPDDFTVGLVARVDPQKDHQTFFKAAEIVAGHFDKLSFILVGRDTNTLTVPTTLTGRLKSLGERQDVSRLLRAFDVAALCSAYGEGFPNAVGEAMATGLPCVVTNTGDAAAIVGETGLVVPPRDPNGFAAALMQLTSAPREALNRRGVLARERIAQHYSIAVAVSRYEALWSDIRQTRSRKQEKDKTV